MAQRKGKGRRKPRRSRPQPTSSPRKSKGQSEEDKPQGFTRRAATITAAAVIGGTALEIGRRAVGIPAPWDFLYSPSLKFLWLEPHTDMYGHDTEWPSK